jgi:hypothetical protein
VPGSTVPDGQLPADKDQGGATRTRVPREPGSGGTPTPTASSSDVPARVGRFEVKRLLGEGMFGRVYEAYDPSLKRIVALKVTVSTESTLLISSCPIYLHNVPYVKRSGRKRAGKGSFQAAKSRKFP